MAQKAGVQSLSLTDYTSSCKKKEDTGIIPRTVNALAARSLGHDVEILIHRIPGVNLARKGKFGIQVEEASATQSKT